MSTSKEMRASWAAFELRAHQIEWRHADGSPCPETLNDRLTTATGGSWWCTTHEQHLRGHPKTPSVPEVELRVASALPGHDVLPLSTANGDDPYWTLARQLHGPEATQADRRAVKLAVLRQLYSATPTLPRSTE